MRRLLSTYRWVVLASALAATVAMIGAARDSAAGPDDPHAGAACADKTLTTFWAADAADKGKWTAVRDSLAHGGAYLSAGPAGVGSSLEFPIEVDRPTQIAVAPLWFIHGDQRKARRFPDTVPFLHIQQDWSAPQNIWEGGGEGRLGYPAPVVSKPGPDAIDVLGQAAFFSAPACGKVGIVDLPSEKVAGAIDVGGYVADLAVDKERGELLVADAANNRVVVFGATDRKRLAEIPVPAMPWSLALGGGKLFVASLMDKKVAVVDLVARKVCGTINLPTGAQHVSIVGQDHPQLVVRLLPIVFDMKTLKEVQPDRLTYWPSSLYGQDPAEGEADALKKASAAFPKAKLKAYFCGVRPMAATLDAGPCHARSRSSYPNKPLPSKVYLIEGDFAGLTVLSPAGATIAKIDLGEAPAAMDLFDLRLYALCKQARKVFVIDTTADKVVQTLALPCVGQEFYAGCLVPRYTTVEQLTSSPVISGEMPGRIAIGPSPLAYDLQTLAPAGEAALPFCPYDRHSTVTVEGSPARKLSVDNLHTIGVEDQAPAGKTAPKSAPPPITRWIDTSSVTDWQLGGNPAILHPGDAPGAVTLSVDGGPECDWENDIWFTPDQRTLLVRGTEEFDLWNGVRFSLQPGKHVLRVKGCSPQANLEGLKVRRTLAGRLDVHLVPLPESVHGKVNLPCYGGVFAAVEPVSFKLLVSDKSGQEPLQTAWTVRDYEGTAVVQGKATLAVAGGTATQVLDLPIAKPGRYTMQVTFSSPDGLHEVFHRFVKLAPLGYPRLLYRPDQAPQIAARVAKYPVLFQRYRDYLRRQSEKADFLPKTIRGAWGQEMVKENERWRPICMEFADLFLEPPGQARYQAQLTSRLSECGAYDAWQGNYEFGGAQSMLMDLMMNTSPAARANLEKNYCGPNVGYIGDGNIYGGCFPDYFLTMKEALRPQDRVVVDRVAAELGNYERYYQAHAGTRGGNWWHGTTAFCHCPIHSMTRTFLWCRSFFGEDRFLERPMIAGVLTLQSYAYPRYDTHTFLDRSAFRETYDIVKFTEAMRWALSGLSRRPLEKAYYKEVFDCIGKLSGPMTDEAKEVDELLNPGAGVVIPLYVALGWLDPDMAGVAWEEMPPSMIFDVEGAACMKSGWDPKMTDIYFVSGVKDITYHSLPNHFQVFKAGEMVVGVIRTGDHGCPVPMYGNCVRVGEDEKFSGYLSAGWGYDRMEERFVTDCFTTLGYTRMFRDWRLTGYRQEGTNWEGGGHPHAYPREAVMHSHTSHPFFAEGKVLAYETSPRFDYVVGDATNGLPLDDVQSVYRQFLYVRPDVMVIYDRVVLGQTPKSVKWPLMTLLNTANPRGNPALAGEVFTASNGVASLWGRALLPKGGSINSTLTGVEGWKDSVGYVEIRPPGKPKEVEYLVALRVGLTKPEALDCTLVEEAGQAGLKFDYDDRSYSVQFNRQGAVGGHIRIEQGGKVEVDRALAQEIRDTYENWKGQPLFEKWMHEDRFKPYMTEADLTRFGGAK